MKAFLSVPLILFSIITLASCEPIGDSLRNWGEESRRSRIKNLSEQEVATWEKDLNLSREKAEELHQNIEKLVRETSYQGTLSRKIAHAYMQRGLHEQAIPHLSAALENRLQRPDQEFGERISKFDNAIPYYNEALKRTTPHPDLIFETALCYANASIDLGWEESRWKVAVYLFDRMRQMVPEDTRPLYQLALLYGKTTNSRLRDVEFAIRLLREVVAKQDNDVPTRFALAHMLAENGDLVSARSEYQEILTRIENLHDSGILSGNPEKNQQYLRAKENMEILDSCIAGSPSCNLLSP